MYQYKRKIPDRLIDYKSRQLIKNNEMHELFQQLGEYEINYHQLFEEFYFEKNEDQQGNVYFSFLIPETKQLSIEIKDGKLFHFNNTIISLDIFSDLDQKIICEKNKLLRKQFQSKRYLHQEARIQKLLNLRQRKQHTYFVTISQMIGYSTDKIIVESDKNYTEFLNILREANRKIIVKPH